MALSAHAALLSALASRYRLIQLDHRGTGDSTRGLRSDHSCEHYVDDLETVLDKLQVTDVVLLGGVFSAHTAIRYTARHPDRVRGIILVNPASADHAWSGNKLWEDMYTNSWEMFVRTFAQAFEPEGNQDWVDYFEQTVTHADYLVAARALEVSRLDAMLPSVKSPTLILASREPRYPPLLDAAKAYAARLPVSQLILFDGEQNREIVSPGGSKLPPAIPVIEEFLRNLPAPVEVSPAADPAISERETEVLRLVGQGKSNAEIACDLFITRNTVQNHLKSVYRKAGLQNRAQAAVYAKEHRIV